jgi:hypothetical protein
MANERGVVCLLAGTRTGFEELQNAAIPQLLGGVSGELLRLPREGKLDGLNDDRFDLIDTRSTFMPEADRTI